MDNKQNVNDAEKKKRARGENWTQEEKNIFLKIMRQSAYIIENKKTDTNSNKRKSLEWVRIKKKLNEQTGICRDIPQLKGLWKRSKLAAKKHVSQHRKNVQATVDWQQPSPLPSNDLIIGNLCSTNFIKEENMSDSSPVEVSPFILDIESSEKKRFKKTEPEKLTMVKGINANNKSKNEDTSTEAIIESNAELKQQVISMLEEENALKIEYQKRELAHQQLRHELEIDLLLLEKEKKILQIDFLKKKLQ